MAKKKKNFSGCSPNLWLFNAVPSLFNSMQFVAVCSYRSRPVITLFTTTLLTVQTETHELDSQLKRHLLLFISINHLTLYYFCGLMLGKIKWWRQVTTGERQDRQRWNVMELRVMTVEKVMVVWDCRSRGWVKQQLKITPRVLQWGRDWQRLLSPE